MRATEFLTELAPKFVNKVIAGQPGWQGPTGKKYPPRGLTASVWQHAADPNTVVKVVGGGNRMAMEKDKQATIAFVDFLVHHGNTSPHFPICYGINVEDPEVVQVRFEKLYPLPYGIGSRLEQLAFATKTDRAIRKLDEDLIADGISEKNKAIDIAAAIKYIKSQARHYGRKYNCQLNNDLHAGNWMMTKDKVIVMSDPWFSGWTGRR